MVSQRFIICREKKSNCVPVSRRHHSDRKSLGNLYSTENYHHSQILSNVQSTKIQNSFIKNPHQVYKSTMTNSYRFRMLKNIGVQKFEFIVSAFLFTDVIEGSFALISFDILFNIVQPIGE